MLASVDREGNRLTGLINVAYSETVTLGAYFGMWINTTFDLNFYMPLPG